MKANKKRERKNLREVAISSKTKVSQDRYQINQDRRIVLNKTIHSRSNKIQMLLSQRIDNSKIITRINRTRILQDRITDKIIINRKGEIRILNPAKQKLKPKSKQG